MCQLLKVAEQDALFEHLHVTQDVCGSVTKIRQTLHGKCATKPSISFPFPRLPPELRRMVYQLSMNSHDRVLRARSGYVRAGRGVPALMHVCRESRAEILRHRHYKLPNDYLITRRRLGIGYRKRGTLLFPDSDVVLMADFNYDSVWRKLGDVLFSSYLQCTYSLHTALLSPPQNTSEFTLPICDDCCDSRGLHDRYEMVRRPVQDEANLSPDRMVLFARYQIHRIAFDSMHNLETALGWSRKQTQQWIDGYEERWAWLESIRELLLIPHGLKSIKRYWRRESLELSTKVCANSGDNFDLESFGFVEVPRGLTPRDNVPECRSICPAFRIPDSKTSLLHSSPLSCGCEALEPR